MSPSPVSWGGAGVMGRLVPSWWLKFPTWAQGPAGHAVPNRRPSNCPQVGSAARGLKDPHGAEYSPSDTDGRGLGAAWLLPPLPGLDTRLGSPELWLSPSTPSALSSPLLLCSTLSFKALGAPGSVSAPRGTPRTADTLQFQQMLPLSPNSQTLPIPSLPF